ncbi:hypothetical protein PSACC_00622 [Paramicrosporidium saccamoebae]|uniref:Uncharacterized protein n=1 Tax=Paramicrosporidium saccamoebae TaxID=1246581 RepID=A0A2H9TP86_9FUNG|nr:hypothetical protein PSACC_00622 [Paramicrosporidium saccamoebae]
MPRDVGPRRGGYEQQWLPYPDYPDYPDEPTLMNPSRQPRPQSMQPARPQVQFGYPIFNRQQQTPGQRPQTKQGQNSAQMTRVMQQLDRILQILRNSSQKPAHESRMQSHQIEQRILQQLKYNQQSENERMMDAIRDMLYSFAQERPRPEQDSMGVTTQDSPSNLLTPISDQALPKETQTRASVFLYGNPTSAPTTRKSRPSIYSNPLRPKRHYYPDVKGSLVDNIDFPA